MKNIILAMLIIFCVASLSVICTQLSDRAILVAQLGKSFSTIEGKNTEIAQWKSKFYKLTTQDFMCGRRYGYAEYKED